MLSESTRRQDYTGNGATTVYSFGFRVDDQTELKVVKRDTSTPPIETTLVITTDYTVSGVGVDAGGSITLTTALPLNYTLTIFGEPVRKQNTDFQNQGSFYPKDHEKTFDRIVAMCQRLAERMTRTIRQPETEQGSDFHFPFAAQRANQLLGFDGSGNPIASQPSSSLVSSFMQPVVAATNAAAAWTGLGIASFVQTLLDDADATTARQTLQVFDGSFEIKNLGISASVASNALTLALKSKAGTDPTSTDAVVINFRSATSTTGTYNRRTVTSALSVTVPSGTTIGTANATQAYIYVYALDNAGVVELAVSLFRFDEGSIQNTSAISGGSSATTLYSTTARTGVPIRLIGRLSVTETTAGTWATAPTEISNVPFVIFPVPTVQKFTSGSGTYTTPAGVKYLRVRMVGGGAGGAGSGTGSWGTATDGGASTFGTSLLTANGGSHASGGENQGGQGGSASLGTAVGIGGTGGSGGTSTESTTSSAVGGGVGGASMFGGGGYGGWGGAGQAGQAPGSGGGGGGTGAVASCFGGSGGGAGGFVDALIYNPAATYSYAVGAAGSSGSNGTSGFGGGSGAVGIIIVEEFYQ